MSAEDKLDIYISGEPMVQIRQSDFDAMKSELLSLRSHSRASGVRAAPRVTRDEAIAFMNRACRNWPDMPALSEDDIGDLASELLRFALAREALSQAQGEGV